MENTGNADKDAEIWSDEFFFLNFRELEDHTEIMYGYEIKKSKFILIF